MRTIIPLFLAVRNYITILLCNNNFIVINILHHALYSEIYVTNYINVAIDGPIELKDIVVAYTQFANGEFNMAYLICSDTSGGYC